MSDYYILDGHKAIPCTSLEWARWYETAKQKRIVAKDTVCGHDISTVFLGLDHQWNDVGPPHIFETMVFGGPLDQEQERCSTWEQAEKMHGDMCNRVRAVNKTEDERSI